MNKKYLISLEDNEKKGFHHVIDFHLLGFEKDFESLEELDKFTKSINKKDLIEEIITMNIYPDLDKEKEYELKIIYKDTKIRYLPLIDSESQDFFEFSLEDYFSNKGKVKYSLLYNRLNNYLQKNHIRSEYKNFIKSLKNNHEEVFDLLNALNYEEKRELKLIILGF